MIEVAKAVLLDIAAVVIVFCIVYIAYEIRYVMECKKRIKRANKIMEEIEHDRQ